MSSSRRGDGSKELTSSSASSGAGFIVVLIVMLAVRGSLDHNRIFDFTTNLLLAGTIIFVRFTAHLLRNDIANHLPSILQGGGPVVIPLLRGYTVDKGW